MTVKAWSKQGTFVITYSFQNKFYYAKYDICNFPTTESPDLRRQLLIVSLDNLMILMTEART